MPKFQPLPAMGIVARFIADLPWGAEDPAKPRVDITISGDSGINVRLEIARTTTAEREHALKHLAVVLPPKSAAEVLAAEEHLFAWLHKDPSHPTRFVADPLGALGDAGVKLEPHIVARLAKHREGHARAQTADTFERIRSLSIGLARAHPTLKSAKS